MQRTLRLAAVFALFGYYSIAAGDLLTESPSTPLDSINPAPQRFVDDDLQLAPLHGGRPTPPMLELETQSIEDELLSGEISRYVIPLHNLGLRSIAFFSQLDIVRVPEGMVRGGRRNQGENIPQRDEFGEILDQFRWNRVWANAIRAGVAYDPINDEILLTGYEAQAMAILDANDFNVIREWNLDWEGMMGATWLGGLYYTIEYNNNLLCIWDRQGNSIERMELPNRAVSLSSSPELNLLFIGESQAPRNINIYTPGLDLVGRIWGEDYLPFLGNNRTRSICWVDKHTEGHLWVNTGGRIWQLAIDPDNWDATGLVQTWETEMGGSYWDALGHDGENLIYSPQGQENYLVVDDGVRESNWISWEPQTGNIPRQSSIDITLTLNATGIPAGEYEADIQFITNDPRAPEATLGVELRVIGSPHIGAEWDEQAGFPESIRFNDVYPEIYGGGEYGIDVTIASIGLETLHIRSIETTGAPFTVEDRELELEPRDEEVITVSFNPEGAGVSAGELRIASNDPSIEVLTISLIGEAFDPPVINVVPNQLEEELGNDESVENIVTIENRGRSTLNYSLDHILVREPGRDERRRSLRRDEPGDLLAQYDSRIREVGGMASDGETIWGASYGSNQVVGLTFGGEFVRMFGIHGNPIAMACVGEELWIGTWSESIIRVYDRAGRGLRNFNLRQGEIRGMAVIGDHTLLANSENDNLVHVYRLADMVETAQFSTMAATDNNTTWGMVWVSSHRGGELWCNTGRILYQLDVDENWNCWQVQSFVWNAEWGMCGPAHDGENMWRSSWDNGTNWFVYDDGVNEANWLEYSPNTGQVEPGTESEIAVTINSLDLLGGEYEAELHVASNDPSNADVVVNVLLTILGEPETVAWWAPLNGFPDVLDLNRQFPDLFTGLQFQTNFFIRNEGTAFLNVRDIVPSDDHFRVNIAQAGLGPGESQEVVLTFSTRDGESGDYAATITILSNDPDNPELPFNIHARAGTPPQIIVHTNAIETELATGQTEIIPVRVENAGEAPLRFTVTPRSIREPDRDDLDRALRSGNTGRIPDRDAAGDVLGEFVWNDAREDRLKTGIAYDYNNNLLLVTCYQPNWIAILDPAENYRVVLRWVPVNQRPGGAAWLNGIFYTVDRATNRVHTWDVNGNNLGSQPFGFQLTAIAASSDLQLLFVMDQNSLDIYVFRPDFQAIGEIAWDNYRNFVRGNRSGAICWVDHHDNGQLWVNTDSHLSQLHINTNNWSAVELVQEWQTDVRNGSYLDGIAHDRHNLIYGSYGNPSYLILDDGIEEVVWLACDPDSGTVEGGEELVVSVYLEAQSLSPGEYEGDLVFSSNDPEAPDVETAVLMEVLTAPAMNITWPEELGFPNILDFNRVDPDLQAGEPVTVELRMVNPGQEDLRVGDISSENNQFIAWPDSFSLAPRQSRVISVAFLAEERGDFESELTIRSNSPGREAFNIPLHARAFDPPVIRVAPNQIEEELVSGDSTETHIVVENRGDATLRFTIGREIIREGGRDVGGRTLRNIESSQSPVRDEPGDIIAQHFNHRAPNSGMAFDGENVWSLDFDDDLLIKINLEGDIINTFGIHDDPLAMTFDGEALWIGEAGENTLRRYDLEGRLLRTTNLNIAWLQGLGCDLERYFYAHDSEENIIHVYELQDFQEIGTMEYFGMMQEGSVGNMTYAVEDASGPLWISCGNEVVEFAIEQGWQLRVMQRIGWRCDSWTAGFTHVNGNLWYGMWGEGVLTVIDDGVDERNWLAVEPDEGAISSGESMDVTVFLNAEGLGGGEYEASLNFNSNDPQEPVLEVNVLLQVNPAPQILVDRAGGLIDWDRSFETMFTNTDYLLTLGVANIGTAPLTIESIAAGNGQFRAEPAEAVIQPRDNLLVNLILNGANAGLIESELTIRSNSRFDPVVTIPLQGTLLVPPDIGIDRDAFEFEISTGETGSAEVTISNTGGSDLVWRSFVRVFDPERDNGSRSLRGIGSAAPPQRDPVVGTFRWAVAGAGRAKTSIAWDPVNYLVWVAAYNDSRVAILDPTRNYQVVREWNFPNNGPMGAAWLQGEFYVVNFGFNHLQRYDVDGNNLGVLQFNFSPTSVAASRELGLLFVTQSNASRDIDVVQPDGRFVGRISGGSYEQFFDGGRQRSMCWVDRHEDGQLWMNTPGWIYQMHVDTERWRVDRRGPQAPIRTNAGSPSEWDGLAHDGRNLIYGSSDEVDYMIFDDGIEELSWFGVTPEAGRIAPAEESAVDLVIDPGMLAEGRYRGELVIQSNDPDEPDVVIALSMTLHGAAMIDVTPGGVAENDEPADFGVLYFGESDTLTLQIANLGTDLLRVDDISCEEQSFRIIDLDLPLEIRIAEAAPIGVVFQPDSIGEFLGEIVIDCNDGRYPDGYLVELYGEGIGAPVIQVQPDNFEADLNVGDMMETGFTVRNTGLSDLVWYSQLGIVERDNGGRSLRSNDAQPGPGRDRPGDIVRECQVGVGTTSGMAFDGDLVWGCSFEPGRLFAADILGNEVRDVQIHDSPLAMTFDGRYLWIGGWQGSTIRQYDLTGRLINTFNLNIGTIYGLAFDGDSLIFVNSGADNRIHILGRDGHRQVTTFSIRQAVNNREVWGICWVPQHLGGHLWALAEGELFQLSVGANWVAQQVQRIQVNNEQAYVGPAHDGRNMWYGSWNQNIWYAIDDGVDEVNWLWWEPREGIIPPNVQTNVEVRLDATNIDGGEYSTRILVESNDPEAPITEITLSLDVTGVPRIATQPPCAPMGEGNVTLPTTRVDVPVQRVVTLRNSGSDALHVSNMWLEDGVNFSIEPVEADLPPLERLEIPIFYTPLVPGDVADRLYIRTDAVNVGEGEQAGLIWFNLSGHGTTAPVLHTYPAAGGVIPVLADINREREVRDFRIANASGEFGEPLHWTLSLRAVEPERDEGLRSLRSVEGRRRVPLRDPDGRGLLIQNRCQWRGFEYERYFSGIEGLEYTRIRDWNEFEMIDLGDYDFLWIGNYEPEVWVAAYNRNRALIEEWVNDGGAMYFSSGTNNHATRPVNPGGLVYHWAERAGEASQNDCPIDVNPEDNWFINYMNDNDPTGWPWRVGQPLHGAGCAHGVFYEEEVQQIENSDWYQVIARGNPSNQPIAVVYGFGRGYCFVTTTTDGFLHFIPDRYQWGRTGEAVIYYLDFLSTNGRGWISASPRRGTIEHGQEMDVRLIFNPLDIVPDSTYRATITVLSDDPENPEIQVGIEYSTTPRAPTHFNGEFVGERHTLNLSRFIVNEESAQPGWEVGVFTPDGIPGGGTVWYGPSDLNVVTAFADNPETDVIDGFRAGEVIVFRAWDFLADREYRTELSDRIDLVRWQPGAFTAVELLCQTRVERRIELREGWNMISMNIIPPPEYFRVQDGPDVRLLTEGLRIGDGDRLQLLKDEDGLFYSPRHDFCNIPFWNLMEGYQLRLSQPVILTWTGLPIPPTEELELEAGWNIVAYYPDYPLSAGSPEFEVISPILDHVRLAKDNDGHFMIPSMGYSNMPDWQPTKGYRILVDEDVMLRYPRQSRRPAASPSPVRSPTHWQPGLPTGADMSLLIERIEGLGIETGDEIAAFKLSGEVCGSGRIENGRAGIAVRGDDVLTTRIDGLTEGEEILLKLWSNRDGREYKLVTSTKELRYRTDDIVSVNVRGILTPDKFALGNPYPNPFNPQTTLLYQLPEAVNVDISVYDLSGRLIETLVEGILPAGFHKTNWMADSHPSGLYIIRMKTAGFEASRKVILSR
jgi:sugar lactone lactonase YvrE